MGFHKFMYTDLTKLTNMFSHTLVQMKIESLNTTCYVYALQIQHLASWKACTLVALHHNPKWFWKHILR